MTDLPSFMRREIDEIPEAVARLLDGSREVLDAAGERLRAAEPRFFSTVARGSSDHAASFLKYAIELTAGLPVASLGPSIASLYGARLRLAQSACIAISQSGRSPDIVAMARAAREGGALTVALTNTADSPLAQACDQAVDIAAGPERSIAATKSFVCSVVAGLALLAAWRRDSELDRALGALPEQLRQALSCDWTALADGLDGADSLFVIGRGPSFPIAGELALKFKETCSLHAEAYSAAEVMHGPLALVRPGFPVLALTVADLSEASMVEAVDQLAAKGAAVFATTPRAGGATVLPAVDTGHPLTAPLALVTSFYGFVEALARRRGLDPDRHPNLRKVTETR